MNYKRANINKIHKICQTKQSKTKQTKINLTKKVFLGGLIER